MIAIEPSGTQIYLFFVYQKPSDRDPHCYKLFAYNWYGARSRVQVSMRKSLRGVQCINLISMTRINRDNKMQCLQKILIKYSIKINFIFP